MNYVYRITARITLFSLDIFNSEGIVIGGNLNKSQCLLQEFKRSREQLDKETEVASGGDKRSSSKSGPHRTPSIESTRFGPSESATATSCYVPGDDILPILIKNSHPVPSNGSMYNPNIYTVDNDDVPKMCDSACQTRESLFTTQE